MGTIYPVQGEPERMQPEVIPDTAIPEHGPSSAWPRQERDVFADPQDCPDEYGGEA